MIIDVIRVKFASKCDHISYMTYIYSQVALVIVRVH